MAAGQQPLALGLFGGFAGERGGIGELAGRLQLDPGRLALAVEAEIDHHPAEPGAEQRQRLPARRVRPHPQHGFLRHVLGLGGIAEDAAGDPEHDRHMAPGKLAEGALVALGDPGHERFVAVISIDGRSPWGEPIHCSPEPDRMNGRGWRILCAEGKGEAVEMVAGGGTKLLEIGTLELGRDGPGRHPESLAGNGQSIQLISRGLSTPSRPGPEARTASAASLEG